MQPQLWIKLGVGSEDEISIMLKRVFLMISKDMFIPFANLNLVPIHRF